jgi:cytoskeleton protein RodZ
VGPPQATEPGSGAEPGKEMDIGFELRRAREARGISLTELARRTKIRGAMLRAIDNNDLDRLPAGVFTRGFLKTYAREVGVDPEAIAKEYSARLEEQAAAAERERVAAKEAAPDEVPHWATSDPEAGRRAITVVAIFTLAAVALIAVNRWQGSDVAEAPAAAAATVETTPSSVATTGAADVATPPANVSDATLRIELQAQGPCWIEATADGAQVLYRLMNTGDRETLEVREYVVLRIGDPASLKLSINGSPVRPLGSAARPATVRLTPENFKQFLA